MADIVLDMNALRLLLDGKYVDGIIEKGDHVFISKIWKRVYRSIKELSLGFTTISTHIKKLKRRKRLHEVSGKSNLPTVIERELKDKKASEDDFEIARIAYDRRKVQNDIFLVSNDFHFLQLKLTFEQDGIIVETKDEELRRVKIDA